MTRNYGHTAEYQHIAIALKSRWHGFEALTAEMNDFIPRPLSDFESEKKEQLANLIKHNPTQPIEDLEKFVNSQIISIASESMQFHGRFYDRFMTEYVTVILLSHALCEAIINAILAIGLGQANSKELFPLIERADIKEKWCIAPKCFDSSYELPTHSALFETLNRLTKLRNAFVHHKIELHIEGTKIFDGSKFDKKPLPDEIRWLKRFFSLPYDLADYVRTRLARGIVSTIILDRSPIELATVHKQK